MSQWQTKPHCIRLSGAASRIEGSIEAFEKPVPAAEVRLSCNAPTSAVQDDD